MEGAGLLGHPPPLLQNYPSMCRPPLFGAPWQYQSEMHLMQFQYNRPPMFPFGTQSLNTKKKRRRRRRNTSRTSWIGDSGYHKNLEIQIKLGKNSDSQPTINIEMGTKQIANIVVKSTENSQEQNSRQKIRRQSKATSINLSLEAQMPNSLKLNSPLRRENPSLQRFKRRKNSIEGISRRYGIPFKPGTSPLLRDERLNMPKTSQSSQTRNFRRRRNFQNRQNRGKNELQHLGILDTASVVTEMDEEELGLVSETSQLSRTRNFCRRRNFGKRQNRGENELQHLGILDTAVVTEMDEEELGLVNETSQLSRTRNFRRRINFRKRQNRGENEQQYLGIRDTVLVTEMDEEDLEVVQTDGVDLEDSKKSHSFCSDEVLESQIFTFS